MQVLLQAEQTYASANPDLGFTCDLARLGPRATNLIDGALASGSKSGYTFMLENCNARTGAPATTFSVIAVPVPAPKTGIRTFCSDESGVVRAYRDGGGDLCLAAGRPIS